MALNGSTGFESEIIGSSTKLTASFSKLRFTISAIGETSMEATLGNKLLSLSLAVHWF